ncbi:cation:proton antiporter [Dyadobacter psychrophilus]|uniref:Kef-type K+ transport system, membrane component KefB n=1 Tax=Dyadobacter psychrophilus TaxID=651661 RepID=A0A1T5EIN5_9BACT|nr:cation:proton antiporter [Dyadobacter psychrophilus]SKB83794.1 Kef-type K+ transport system, membrane component KefB [Dyadobacter psychrophilus]
MMKNLRNVLFYTITIGAFSALLYFFIKQGKSLENADLLAGDPVATTSSWDQFTDTFQHNLSHPLATLLLQIITIILVARVFGWLCKSIGQPTVIGEIAAGIFLGPSLLGLYFPEFSTFLFPAQSLGNLQFLSQVGLILFMFIIGMELDLKVLKTKAQEAIVISHASIILPFALGVGLALYIYQQFAPDGISFLSFALFIGIALSITAFPVLARIVQERGLSRTKLGMMVITCAATDDITAWCILAAVIAIVKAGDFVSSIYTIILAGAYVFLMLKVLKPVLKRVGDHYSYREGLTKPVVAMFFVVLMFSSYCTEVIGIHALFGAFMAGVIMPANQNFRNIFIEKVEDVSMVLLLPLFFVFTGLRTQIGLLNDLYLWEITGLIIAAAVTGKFIGSAVAARFVNQSWRDSLIIGSLMNTRGLMELVVLNIGYDIGVLSPEIFAMMVIMALATTCMTGPALDLIDRFFPEKKWEAAAETNEDPGFSILIAFASPQGGKKMLRLAYHFIQKQLASHHITALHLSPSSYLNQVNTEEYQLETFRPITEEAAALETQFASLFKPSQNIEHDIIETANAGEYDMLMIGIGRTVFEGTFLGKILGFTSKIISRERLFDTISGKEKLFHADVFDERTTHIIKSVKIPVGILIEKNLSKVENIFIPIFSPDDKVLFQFVRKLALRESINLAIMDPTNAASQSPEIQSELAAISDYNNDRVRLLHENVLEKDFLQQQDLMIISLDSWKKAVESHSLWLSHSPSVLIVRG